MKSLFFALSLLLLANVVYPQQTNPQAAKLQGMYYGKDDTGKKNAIKLTFYLKIDSIGIVRDSIKLLKRQVYLQGCIIDSLRLVNLQISTLSALKNAYDKNGTKTYTIAI